MSSKWFSDKWFVNPFNYVEEVRKNFKLTDKVIIYDTTLRDGKQTPGVVFRKNEKLEIAIALDKAGCQPYLERILKQLRR